MSTERARAAAAEAFPGRTVVEVTDLNRGRGVFSDVRRVRFAPEPAAPDTIAIKLAVAGANGEVARRSGAYAREAVAYQTLLPHLDVHTPECFAVIDEPLGPTFVLEDLSSCRSVDQVDGLGVGDAVAVAAALGRLHASSINLPAIGAQAQARSLRTNTVASLDPATLRRGLATLADRWSDAVEVEQRHAFAHLVDVQRNVSERFAAAGPAVVCHGDPRADNLVFGNQPDRSWPLLFDWQQIARQPGVGDLAWLAATSLEPSVRREAEPTLLEAYRRTSGVDIDQASFRVGFALPGLAVLYLAQREAPDTRTAVFIATSLRRIGQALVDLDVADLGQH